MSKSLEAGQYRKQDQSTRSTSVARRVWRQWVLPLVVVVVVVTSMRSAVADWNDVPSDSMNPTIVAGDRVFVNKLAYGLRLPYTRIELAGWAEPARGDIVTFWAPKSEIRMVKRVVAGPGDEVSVRDGRLYVNGNPAEYTSQSWSTASRFRPFEEDLDGRRWAVQFAPVSPTFPVDVRNVGPLMLGEDEFFMLGDNRDNSHDSRFFGTVSRNRIIGHANRVVLSLDRDRFYLPRTDRWFRPLQ